MGGNPYINNSIEGEIDRRTRYGAGIPKDDLYMFNGKITYDKLRKKWKCLLCNFERGKYGWCQVFGHVASTHCYSTAKNSDRWNIPNSEKHQEENTISYPENIDSIMANDVACENIEIELINNTTVYVCKQCTRFRNTNPISMRNHLSHAHKKCRTKRTICPYCPATFGRKAELKRHFRKKKLCKCR